jgi:hypothetical protein
MSEHGDRSRRPSRSAVLPAWLNAVKASAGGSSRVVERSDQRKQ